MSEPAPLELAPKITTFDVQKIMAAKYSAENGYALFFDVPDNVGLDSRRRADAVSIGLWKSAGRSVAGYEIKVSRSDWLREVKSVEKADPFIERCDKWWLVTASPAIAKLEEIPACWGWMSVTPGGLRVQKPAPLLPQAGRPELSRLFVYGLLRKVSESSMNDPGVLARVEKIREENAAEIDRRVKRGIEENQRVNERLREKVEHFEKELGMSITDWRAAHVAKVAAQLAKLDYDGGGLAAIAKALQGQRATLANMLECLDLAIKETAPP